MNQKLDALITMRTLANSYEMDYDQMIELPGTVEQVRFDPERRIEACRDLRISRKLNTYLEEARKNIKQAGNTFSFTLRRLPCLLII